MKHLADDDLVLYYYAEGDALPEARAHLEACVVCRERLTELDHSLAAVSASSVPERDESYGRDVWARIQPRLNEPERSGLRRWFSIEWFSLPRLAFGGSMAALVVAAFVAGRYWPGSVVTPAPMAGTAALNSTAETDPHNILLASVGGHLERSAMVLAEVANSAPDAVADLSAEQSRAGDLVATNRLIRQTADRQGERGVADVLEELERVLVEITNGPSPMPAADLESIRRRIDDQGLLFKVRVLETQVRERQRASTSGAPASNLKKS